MVMVHENDKLVIPEKYRAMSVAELQKEKEKLLKTMPVKDASEQSKKMQRCSVLFNL